MRHFPSPLCLLRALWWRLRTGADVRGHVFVVQEVHRECTVYVSRCEDCGLLDIGWNHGEAQPDDGRYPAPRHCCRREVAE